MNEIISFLLSKELTALFVFIGVLSTINTMIKYGIKIYKKVTNPLNIEIQPLIFFNGEKVTFFKFKIYNPNSNKIVINDVYLSIKENTFTPVYKPTFEFDDVIPLWLKELRNNNIKTKNLTKYPLSIEFDESKEISICFNASINSLQLKQSQLVLKTQVRNLKKKVLFFSN